jgi:hypothetical protein
MKDHGELVKWAQDCYNEMQENLANVDATLSAAHRDELNELRAMAYQHFDIMIGSPEATEAYVSHDDYDLKYVALSLLATHWRAMSPKTADVVRQLVRSESIKTIVLAGIWCLRAAYGRSKNRSVLDLFAEIVKDETRPIEIRKAAYLGLFQVSDDMQSAPSVLKLDFPKHVDWSFIEDCSRKPGCS